MTTALSFAVAACGGDSGTNPNGGGGYGGGGGGGGGGPTVTTAVTVTGNAFVPSAIQVSPGAMVTWTWASGGVTHNVTFPSAAIDDSADQASGTFQAVMPTTPGTYLYQCTLHSGMGGSVLVQ